MTSSEERALEAARRAHGALELTQTRDAAWLALYALEQDRSCGLAWALAARIVLEATEDSLGTIATRYALSLGVPEPERADVARFHRIDLWTRGLLRHGGGTALLPVRAFGDDAELEKTARYERWFTEQLTDWGDDERAARAVERMVAAFSDAWELPNVEENPLRAEVVWPRKPLFAQWLEADPLKGTFTATPIADSDQDVSVLSDYWIEQEILQIGAQGGFQLARERAEMWSKLRPHRIRPRATLVRVLDAGGWAEDRDRVLREIVELGSHDLNELEEARVTLGELELWAAQIEVLDQMDAIAPGHPVVLTNRGVAFLQIGEAEKGATDLENAIRADPHHGPALANLGLQRMREDEYVAARRLLEHAVEVAPDQAQVRVYLAACKNNQDDRPGAIRELNEALRLDPEHAQAKVLLAELKARGPVPS